MFCVSLVDEKSDSPRAGVMTSSCKYMPSHLRCPELSRRCPPCFVDGHDIPMFTAQPVDEEVDGVVGSEAPGVLVDDCELKGLLSIVSLLL